MADRNNQYPRRQKSNASPFFVVLVVAAFLAVLAFVFTDITANDQQGPHQIGTETKPGEPLTPPISDQAK